MYNTPNSSDAKELDTSENEDAHQEEKIVRTLDINPAI